MNYPIPEKAHSVNGVPGRMFTIHAPQVIRENSVYRNQTWKSESRSFNSYEKGAHIRVEIRFDDSCKNGYQNFSITATITKKPRSYRDDPCIACGCLHDEIAKAFPELKHLIKWHGMGTNGPMHYIANTIYHAGDKDYNGLKKGEKRQIVNGRSNLPAWKLVAIDNEGNEIELHKLENYIDNAEKPDCPYKLDYRAWNKTGEGKERDFDAARSCAAWPEASEEQLSLPAEQLTALLQERAPRLIQAFRTDMEAIGFLWEPENDN